jgi:hypothetical protein
VALLRLRGHGRAVEALDPQRCAQLHVAHRAVRPELLLPLAGPDAEALLGTGQYVEGFFPAGMVLAVREQQAARITALLEKWRREAN